MNAAIDIHSTALSMVDTDRYPIHRHGPERDELLGEIRNLLADCGCAVLRGFVRPEWVERLVEECDRVQSAGHRSFNRTNAYFTQDHPDLDPTHPLRRFYDRSNAFVPGDQFGADSAIRALYEWPPFAPFIQSALQEANFHRYGDPLADVIVNLAEEGNG